MPSGYETNESSVAVILIRGHLDLFLFSNVVRRHVSCKALLCGLKENVIYSTVFTCSSWGCAQVQARVWSSVRVHAGEK